MHPHVCIQIHERKAKTPQDTSHIIITSAQPHKIAMCFQEKTQPQKHQPQLFHNNYQLTTNYFTDVSHFRDAIAIFHSVLMWRYFAIFTNTYQILVNIRNRIVVELKAAFLINYNITHPKNWVCYSYIIDRCWNMARIRLLNNIELLHSLHLLTFDFPPKLQTKLYQSHRAATESTATESLYWWWHC